MLSVKDQAYKIPSLAFGLIVNALVPSGAVFTNVNILPIEIAGKVNTTPSVDDVKVLPEWFKAEVRKKYEEFYPWWEENWELGVPVWHKGKITKEMFDAAPYGIKRLKGMLSFMESEDWSRRLPEMQEFLQRCDAQRGNSFAEVFPEMKDIFDGR